MSKFKGLRIKIVLLFNLLLLNPFTNAQFQNVYFDEMPELAYILSIYQDTEGYMWFGTFNGLIKYDGVDYTVYRYEKSEKGISNPVVHAITEDAQGNIWIGTEHGLNKFNKETMSFTQFKNKGNDSLSFSSTHIRALHIDNKGLIWVGTRGGGINVFNPESLTVHKIMAQGQEPNLSGNLINSLYTKGDSLLFIGLEYNGLNALNIKKQTVCKYFSEPNSTVACTYIDNKNTLWVGMWNKGLYKHEKKNNEFSYVPLLNKSDWTVKSITEDKEGNLWIGTFGDGLIKTDDKGNVIEHFNANEGIENALSNNMVWSLYIDNSNLLWIGSFGNGISKYDKYFNKFNFIRTSAKNKQGLQLGSVRSISECNNTLYLACNNGLYKYSTTGNSYVPIMFDSQKRGYSCIITDKNGDIWLGFNGGLVQYQIKTGKYRYYFKPEFIPNFDKQDVNLIREDNSGNIWFAVYDGGLFKIQNTEIDVNENGIPEYESYILGRGNNNIPSNIIWDMAFTANNDVWLAANTSLCKLNKQSNMFKKVSSVAHSVIAADSRGQLWTGSLGKGLGLINVREDTVEYFAETQGLAGNLINGINIDKQGMVWVSTPNGVSQFNIYTKKFKNYDVSDGITGKRFNINSNYKLSSGELLFGGSNGFVRFNPINIIDNPYTPNVIIRDLKIFNQSVTFEFADSTSKRFTKPLQYIENVKLKPKDKMLTIEFVALAFSATEHIKYAYRLNGFNTDWTYTSSKNPSATYTNLHGGSYLFEVKAANADGVWSDSSTSLKIKVIPPFYKQLWFYLTITIFLLLMTFAIIRKNYQNLQQKFTLAQVQKEKEIARLRNEKLNAELLHKNNELVSKTTILLHKNEKIRELKNNLNDILLKVSVTSRPKLFSLVKFVEKELENDQFWDQFEHQFNLTHNNFLDRFKDAYPEINHKDLKLCAYIRMNLSSHEIATLLNITYKGVEARRQRLRKKLQLDRSNSLNEFILKF